MDPSQRARSLQVQGRLGRLVRAYLRKKRDRRLRVLCKFSTMIKKYVIYKENRRRLAAHGRLVKLVRRYIAHREAHGDPEKAVADSTENRQERLVRIGKLAQLCRRYVTLRNR